VATPAVTSRTDQITSSQAVRAVATALAAVFTAIGWLTGQICTTLAALFFAAGWLGGLCAAALRYGFRQGLGGPSAAKPPAGPPAAP
jgi:hypothetical protein